MDNAKLNILARRNADWLEGRGSAVTSGHVVLIIDDSDTDVFFLLRAFSASKVKNPIFAMRTGAEGVAYLKGEGEYADRTRYPLPKIVFLDLRMPAPDGFAILELKRTLPQLKHTLFVAMSNLDSVQTINRAYNCGASTFLRKPLNADDVRNLVQGFDNCWMTLKEAEPIAP